MRRSTSVLLMVSCTTLAMAGAAFAADPVRQARMTEVILDGPLPVDLLSPEGKTRWDLTALKRKPFFVRSLQPAADGGLTVADGCSGSQTYTDTDGVSVRRWLLPE